MSYKPLSDEDIDCAKGLREIWPDAAEQCRRAEKLAEAVQAIRDSGSGTKSLKAVYDALAAYRGET